MGFTTDECAEMIAQAQHVGLRKMVPQTGGPARSDVYCANVTSASDVAGYRARIEQAMVADGVGRFIHLVMRYPTGSTGMDRHVDAPGIRSVATTLLHPPEGGGQLVLHAPAGPVILATERGVTAVYDPTTPHEVTPVTVGERWVLLSCAIGGTAPTEVIR